MRFSGAITIPAGTQEDAPTEIEIMCSLGVITGVSVLHPPGQAGLVKVQVYHRERQIYPTSPGEWFVGDDTRSQFDSEYPLIESPYVVKVVGVAPDATLDHTVYVEVGVRSIAASTGGSYFVALPEGFVQ